MALKSKQLIELLKRYKIGIIVGGFTGFIAAAYTISQGYDLVTLAESGKGLFDTLISRNAAPIKLAEYKLYTVFILVGSTAGFYMDMMLDKFNIGKRKTIISRRRR